MDLSEVTVPELIPGGQATITHDPVSLAPVGRLTAEVTARSEDASDQASTSQWVVPWILVLVLLFILAAVLAYRKFRRSPA